MHALTGLGTGVSRSQSDPASRERMARLSSNQLVESTAKKYSANCPIFTRIEMHLAAIQLLPEKILIVLWEM